MRESMFLKYTGGSAMMSIFLARAGFSEDGYNSYVHEEPEPTRIDYHSNL